MTEPRETAANFFTGDKTISFSSQDYVWCRRIEKLAEQYPDHVDIRARNQDGSICARLPVSWFKIKPPINRVYTEEQRVAQAERMRETLAVIRESKA